MIFCFYFEGKVGGRPLEESDRFMREMIPLFFLRAVPNTSKPAVALKSCVDIGFLNKREKSIKQEPQLLFSFLVPFWYHLLPPPPPLFF